MPSPREEPDPFRHLKLLSHTKRQTVGDISAIIPTIDRYDYITKSIDSLRAQDPRPVEILVVDQTPIPRRRPEVYAPYEGTEVRVIFLDEAGQSRSRNRAIQEARADWCLLFEDDAEAWKDCIARHVERIERHQRVRRALGGDRRAALQTDESSLVVTGLERERLGRIQDDPAVVQVARSAGAWRLRSRML